MDADEIDDLPDMIRRIAQRTYRGLAVSASGGVVQGTGRAGEQVPHVAQLQHYGLASDPPAGAELVFLETDGGLVVVAERASRPSLTGGQVCLYDAAGAKIKLLNASSGRRVEIGKGGTAKDAARKADAVGSTAALSAWFAAVQAQIIVGGGGDVGLAPTAIGTITGGSATVGIED